MVSLVNRNFFPYKTDSLNCKFDKLSIDELATLLEEITPKMSEGEMERLATTLPLDKLQETVRSRYPEHKDALTCAKQMLQGAKYDLAVLETLSPAIKIKLFSILEAMLGGLESVINAFGVADFFRQPENHIDAEFKAQKIMMLLAMFTTVSTILLPLLGPTLGASMIGGTLLGIAALSLIYPHVKPAPIILPRGENWSRLFRQGNLTPTGGRKETLDAIARALSESTGQTKTHVMLIGKSGVGKTETVKGLVQAIERGDYPDLKGKEVVYFNTADLLGGTEMFSTANKILSQINKSIGNHRDKFILVFDEIHMACKQNEQGALSEQLKTLLDPGKEKFPYCIGITTEEEYFREIYSNNAAFARRFKRIVITDTEDAETVKILQTAMIKQAPQTLLEETLLKTLLKKTKEAFPKSSQPAASLKILSECIKRTNGGRLPLEERVDALRNHLNHLYAEQAGSLPYSKKNDAEFLERDLKRLESALGIQKNQWSFLRKTQEKLAAVKKTILKRVVSMEHFVSNPSVNEKQALGVFLLQSHFQVPALEKNIRKLASSLGMRAEITSQLVDTVIADELENERKAAEATARGQQDLRARV